MLDDVLISTSFPGRAVDGATNTLIGSTTAQIARHCCVNVGIRRVWVLGQQRGRGHDLPGLAVTALGHLFGEPGLLHGVAAIGREALDGGDVPADNLRY
jgi:hypothetical protein